MSSQDKLIDSQTTEFGQLDEIATEWTVDVLADLTAGKIVNTPTQRPYVTTMKLEDSKTHETKTVKKPYIFAEFGGKILPVRLNKFSQDNLSEKYGTDLRKWAGKSVVAVHQEIGQTKFVTLKPAGKL